MMNLVLAIFLGSQTFTLNNGKSAHHIKQIVESGLKITYAKRVG